jgi:hypothetical protein
LTRLSWSSSSPFQASARVLNANALSTWQNWLVAVTIVLTLASSLLAAVLFDLVPPLHTKGNSKGSVAPALRDAFDASSYDLVSAPATTEPPAIADRRQRDIAAAFAFGSLFAWVLTRWRSGQRSTD